MFFRKLSLFYLPVFLIVYFCGTKGKLPPADTFGYLSDANENHILSELIRLYGEPQRNYPPDQYSDFIYMWLTGKTSLYFTKLKSAYGTGTSVELYIISKKLAMAAKNNQL